MYKEYSAEIKCDDVIESLSNMLKYILLPDNEYGIKIIVNKGKDKNASKKGDLEYLFDRICNDKDYLSRLLCVDIIISIINSNMKEVADKFRDYPNYTNLVGCLKTEASNNTLSGSIAFLLASLVEYKPSLQEQINEIYPNINSLLKFVKQLITIAKSNDTLLQDESGIPGYIVLIPLYPKLNTLEKTDSELFLNIMSMLKSTDLRTLKGALCFALSVLKSMSPTSLLQQYNKIQWINQCYEIVKLQQPSLYYYVSSIIEQCYLILVTIKTNYFLEVITPEQMDLLCMMNDSFITSEVYHSLALRYTISTYIDNNLLIEPRAYGCFFIEETKLLGTSKVLCDGYLSNNILYIYQVLFYLFI